MKSATTKIINCEVEAQTVLTKNILQVQNLSLTMQNHAILHDLSFNLPDTGITTLIGPSGAGKSSILHCLNGLLQQWTGTIQIDKNNTRHWPGGMNALRRYAGLIGQKPCVFPCSIYDNVTFGIRGFNQRRKAHALAEGCLRAAALWDEVKDRLNMPAQQLSIGQQQRLCLARALAIKPGLLLLDEPTASLDPKSKQLIEQSLLNLSKTIPMLYVTHDIAQAMRISKYVIFICEGRIIEQAAGSDFFERPQRIESREFLKWSVCDC